MSIPKVSIGVPVYNGERFLRECLDSLLSQTFSDFELVISDNASTDKTEGICREYESRDQRVKYFRFEQNVGGPRNFNRVFGLCRGTYQKWSTSDDFWAPDMLEKSVGVLDENPEVVLAYPKSNLMTADGTFVECYEDSLHLYQDSPSARFIQILETSRLCHAHLGVIRSDALRRTGLIGDQLASDIHFLAEMSLYGKFHLVPEYLFFRRFHPNSSSWDRKSSEHQQKYYDPSRLRSRNCQTWRKYWHLNTAVLRSPISPVEKKILLRYLYEQALWDDREIMKVEISSVMKRYFSGVSRFLHSGSRSKEISE